MKTLKIERNKMKNAKRNGKVAFITGANRGLGLEFARQYAGEGWRVIATCRDRDRAGELAALRGAVEVHLLRRVIGLHGALDPGIGDLDPPPVEHLG